MLTSFRMLVCKLLGSSWGSSEFANVFRVIISGARETLSFTRPISLYMSNPETSTRRLNYECEFEHSNASVKLPLSGTVGCIVIVYVSLDYYLTLVVLAVESYFYGLSIGWDRQRNNASKYRRQSILALTLAVATAFLKICYNVIRDHISSMMSASGYITSFAWAHIFNM